jgi:isochorismate pyruvate lyase
MNHAAPLPDDSVPPEDCATMDEVRAGVDGIDRALVTLLARRQRYMAAAARIKPRRDQVYDAARIENVVAKILAAAGREGLSAAIAEPVWRLLIDRSIAFELAEWDRLRADPSPRD